MTTTLTLTAEEFDQIQRLSQQLGAAIVRTLITEVDEPMLRRLAIARAAEAFGMRAETVECGR